MLSAFALFIVACASGRYFTNGDPSIGPFYSCTGYNSGCSQTGSCNSHTEYVEQSYIPDCNTFDAMRGCLVIATILSGLATVLLFLYSCLGHSALCMYHIISIFIILTVLAGIASMACGIVWNNDNLSWDYGVGFDLAVAAWCIAFITMGIWVCGYGTSGYITTKV